MCLRIRKLLPRMLTDMAAVEQPVEESGRHEPAAVHPGQRFVEALQRTRHLQVGQLGDDAPPSRRGLFTVTSPRQVRSSPVGDARPRPSGPRRRSATGPALPKAQASSARPAGMDAGPRGRAAAVLARSGRRCVPRASRGPARWQPLVPSAPDTSASGERRGGRPDRFRDAPPSFGRSDQGDEKKIAERSGSEYDNLLAEVVGETTPPARTLRRTAERTHLNAKRPPPANTGEGLRSPSPL